MRDQVWSRKMCEGTKMDFIGAESVNIKYRFFFSMHTP
jgi:hypothetical protein